MRIPIMVVFLVGVLVSCVGSDTTGADQPDPERLSGKMWFG